MLSHIPLKIVEVSIYSEVSSIDIILCTVNVNLNIAAEIKFATMQFLQIPTLAIAVVLNIRISFILF